MAGALATVPPCVAVAVLLGARVNTTQSLPYGLYWVVKEPPGLHGYVMFCPHGSAMFEWARERRYLHEGRCPSGVRPLLKRVSGVPGDVVEVTPHGVHVNGVALPMSRPLPTDAAGRDMPRLPAGPQTIAHDELWVMSDTNPRSFDSRYFGAIPRAWVLESVRPVLTWNPLSPEGD